MAVHSMRALMTLIETAGSLDIESPGFKRWFGHSRVVDTNGMPLIVYHGTNQTFDKFSKKRGGLATGKGAGAIHGFFFTDDYDEAMEYAQSTGRKVVAHIDAHEKEIERLRRNSERLEQIAQRTGRAQDWDAYEAACAAWEAYETGAVQQDAAENVQVVSAYLSLQSPLEAHFHDGLHSEYGVIQDVVEKAVRDGHDGVILRGINDSPVGSRISNHYVAFSNRQIRRV